MTDIIWPMIRNFLVIGILLSAMWHPEKKKRRDDKHGDDAKGEWTDAEYEVID